MASSSRSKATPSRIAVAQRECEALELRKAGKTFEEIADALGYAERGGAAKAVSRALAATVQEPADELRRLQAARLDALWGAMWPRAMEGELGAVDRCLAIEMRRARLFGVDAPARRAVEVVTRDVWDRLMDELRGETAELEVRAIAAGIDISDLD